MPAAAARLIMLDDGRGGYRRALRWTNLVLLVIAIALALIIGPFR